MFKIVKCPEASTLELVECLDTPLGHLIHRCTRFRPTCAMKCTRRCATELDRAADGPLRESGHLALDLDLEAGPEPIS